MGFQKSPPAGSDFALRATQGQSRLLEAHTSSPKTLSVEGERATQGQSQLLAVPIASPKTLCVEGIFYFLIQFSCTCAMLKRYFQSVS